MKVMFLDESGSHNLTVIDPQYPVFVLGGVIVDADYAAGPVEQRLRCDAQGNYWGRGLMVLPKE